MKFTTAALATFVVAAAAQAQTTYTDPYGRVIGRSNTIGNTTTYSDPYGHVIGRSNTIGNAFSRLKDFRRIATRYDKPARNLLASICLVAATVWWI